MPAPERPADADRDSPGPAHDADGPLLPRPRQDLARPRGRGAARDRAGDARARRQRAVAPRLPAALAPGSRCRSTAPGGSAVAGRGGARAGRGGERVHRRRSSSPAGSTRVSVLAPTEDPAYRPLRPKLALPPGAGTRVRRGRPPALAPVGGRAGAAARGGQGVRLPGRRLRASRPVALRLAPLLRGRRAGQRLRDGLARPLPRPRGHARQPAAGPLARRHASRPRSPRAACRWPPSTIRRATTSGPATCGATSRR